MKHVRQAALFTIYALTLFNIFVWMIWPEILYAVIWKWDIFVTVLWAPLIYSLRDTTAKDEK